VFLNGEELNIGFVTGRPVAGAGEAQTERILSKRHPKRDINKGLVGRHLMPTCRGTSSFASVVIILSIDYPTLLFFVGSSKSVLRGYTVSSPILREETAMGFSPLLRIS
jgi:hypothetical protein